MTAFTPTLEHARGQSSTDGDGLFGSALTILETWRQRGRQRRELAALPREILRDIGIDPAEALYESQKPFWVE